MTASESLDYRRVAVWYRDLVINFGLSIAAFVSLIPLPRVSELRLIILGGFWLAVVFCADRILRAQGKPSYTRNSYLIMLFLPVLSFFVVLMLLHEAAETLRMRGLRVAWYGVPRGELDMLLPGHCLSCGYDCSGLSPDAACPECGIVLEPEDHDPRPS